MKAQRILDLLDRSLDALANVLVPDVFYDLGQTGLELRLHSSPFQQSEHFVSSYRLGILALADRPNQRQVSIASARASRNKSPRSISEH